MLNAFLVALAVFICVGGAELVGFTMLNRPIVIGPLVGLFLGDLHTGVIIGASLEAVFMGVVNIGGASAAEPGIATAVGTAFLKMISARQYGTRVVTMPGFLCSGMTAKMQDLRPVSHGSAFLIVTRRSM